MTIDDIDGTRTRKDPVRPAKDILYIKDIEGASCKVPYQRKTVFDSIEVSSEWKSKRQGNPLNPEYVV